MNATRRYGQCAFSGLLTGVLFAFGCGKDNPGSTTVTRNQEQEAAQPKETAEPEAAQSAKTITGVGQAPAQPKETAKPLEKVITIASASDAVNAYVDRALLLASGDKDSAFWALQNAKVFGRRTEEIDAALAQCPEPKVIFNDKGVNEQGMRDVEYIGRWGKADDVDIKKLFDMTTTDKDGVEANMLADKELIGNGRLQGMRVTVDGQKIDLVLFLTPNTLSMKAVRKKYGAPAQTFESPGGTTFHFYGRICLLEKGNDVFVVRFKK